MCNLTPWPISVDNEVFCSYLNKEVGVYFFIVASVVSFIFSLVCLFHWIDRECFDPYASRDTDYGKNAIIFFLCSLLFVGLSPVAIIALIVIAGLLVLIFVPVLCKWGIDEMMAKRDGYSCVSIVSTGVPDV